MHSFEKEWCSITLLDRFKLCLQFEFNLSQLDLLMIGFQLTSGLAITLVGITIAIQWEYTKVSEL
jgi:hypothetical protein